MPPEPQGPGPAEGGAARPGHVHDIVAVGLGPFNLGLAALAEPVEGLDVVVLERREEFRWHPGLLIEGTTLQVPFLADLVTMADPTSRWSFLSHLKQVGRLYPYYIRESFYPLRAEYDAYCRWVAERLPGLRFGHEVTGVERIVQAGGPHDGQTVHRVVSTGPDGAQHVALGRHLVLGVGTEPVVPAAVQAALEQHPERVIHSAQYLPHRDRLRATGAVTVVGSGQSAAEIYRDLLGTLDPARQRLDWVTRSPRFAPMEYTKLTLEMTSPEYVRYFHGLPPAERERLGRQNRLLYKGISAETIDDIFDLLYQRRVEHELTGGGALPTALHTASELTGIEGLTGIKGLTGTGGEGDGEGEGGPLTLRWRHTETGQESTTRTDAVVLATGYAARLPRFVEGLREHLRLDEQGRYDVSLDFRVDDEGLVLVQNAEEHTHGLSAPDLGMGAWRNAQIINAVCGREVYPVEQRIAAQTFGAPA